MGQGSNECRNRRQGYSLCANNIVICRSSFFPLFHPPKWMLVFLSFTFSSHCLYLPKRLEMMLNSWQRIFRRRSLDPCTWNPLAIDIFSFVFSVIVPLFCWMQAPRSIRHRTLTVPPDSLPDIDCFLYRNLRSLALRSVVSCTLASKYVDDRKRRCGEVWERWKYVGRMQIKINIRMNSNIQIV